MTPTIRYPVGPITPHGSYHILHDRIPQVSLLSYDNSVVFNLMGGLAIPDRTRPERVEIKNISGLIPPWQTVDQKGATEDGTTFVDAFYDPMEVELKVKVHGRNPAYARKVHNHLIASIDAKKTSQLAWTTHELGRWWADLRWFKTPSDSVAPISSNGQELSLRLRADNAFWQSYPNVDDFRFTYAATVDTFEVADADDLGTGWTIAFSGGGSGIMKVANGEAQSTIAGGRQAAARRVGYTSSTNNQVVEVEIGTLGQWWWPTDAFPDMWARMANTGTVGNSGVRVRLKRNSIRVSYFVAGVETLLRETFIFIPPLPGEKFTFVAGVEGNERAFKVLRNGAPLMNFKEVGTGSPLGASNRSAGFGMYAGSTVAPAGIRKWSAGDNSTVSQTGFLKRVNMGDQDFWDRYTCFGPGTFRFGNGPNSNDMVEFGPLLPNQIMQIRTDPRKRGVVDMTSVPPSPQELDLFQQALKDFISFATGNNVPPLLQAIESLFGIAPPQGNPYSLMKGRFSNPIPARSPGLPVTPYHVRVEIDDGNADSRVIAAATPLRRNPY